jgi:hypothetical protein
VCIACSQLEKLRANFVDIKQRQNTSEQDSGAESDQKEEELHTSQDVFRHMQEQLNDCIRHHQNTLEYDYYSNIMINKSDGYYSANSAFQSTVITIRTICLKIKIIRI